MSLNYPDGTKTDDDNNNVVKAIVKRYTGYYPTTQTSLDDQGSPLNVKAPMYSKFPLHSTQL